MFKVDQVFFSSSFFFHRKTSKQKKRMLVNAYLLSSSLCVCNDDHLSRDKHRGLALSLSLSRFSITMSFSFSLSLSLSLCLHQTLFFSRIVINSFTANENEKARARGADKTFREVVPCDGLSLSRRSFVSYFLFP